MSKFLPSLLFYIVIFLKTNIFRMQRYTYEFKILQDTDYEEFDLNYSTSAENLLINRNIPVFKNIFFVNDNSTYDLFLNSGSYISWIADKECKTCTWADKKYKTVKSCSDIIRTFSYGKISGYNDIDKVKFIDAMEKIDFSFLSVTKSEYMSTKVKFSGTLGIGDSDSKSSEISLATNFFSHYNLSKIIMIDYSKQKNNYTGQLLLGEIPENFANNITFCSKYNIDSDSSGSNSELDNYWSCKMDYILFGQEYDFYLAKYVNQFVIFDTLSYFHIVPYNFIDYFLSSYFFPNHNCTVVPINYNSTLNRIECNNKIGIQRFRTLNIILNGWSYRLGSETLFDQEDVLDPKNTKNNTFYFRVLFSKLTDGYWTIGNSFLNKYVMGYNYESNKVIFYGTDRHNFTLFTDETMMENRQLFILLLIVLGVILFFLIAVMWIVFYMKKRRIIKSYEAANNISNLIRDKSDIMNEST